tara:strand:+ start:3826 stop:4401 length:576 start_codon:yes stop_codon:yes gene_type:complete
MTSVLKVDNIQNSSGTSSMTIASNGFVIPPAGGIIQMQYDQFTGTDTQSFASQTATVIDNLSVTITPTSTSSIIKLEGHVFFEYGETGGEYNHMFYFYRDSTQLAAPNAGNRTAGITQSGAAFYSSDANTTPQAAYYAYFDAPSTTSAITYKLGATFGSASTFYMNRTVNDGNDYSKERGISFISATEIAG